jgi:hypothetical protein
MPPVAHTVLSLLLAGAAVAGFEPTVTPRLIAQALSIGQSRIDSVRTRFHQVYRLQVSRPPIDYIDIVTPFRRVVLLAEERTQLGIRGFTQSEAAAALGARADVVELRVEMTFHPQNAFVGVPAYDVELVTVPPAPAGRLKPRKVELNPRFGVRLETAPQPSPAGGSPSQRGGGAPLTGGTIAAAFAIGMLNGTGVYDVVVSEKGKELARARVNFAGLR